MSGSNDSPNDSALVNRIRERLALLPISAYSIEQRKARDAEVAALDRLIAGRGIELEKVKSVVREAMRKAGSIARSGSWGAQEDLELIVADFAGQIIQGVKS